MNRFLFVMSLLRENALSYLGGAVMVGMTLWMSLTIPVYLQEAIDILAKDPDPSGSAFLNRVGWILAFALAIMFTRTASRLLFFTPGRQVEFNLKNRLLAHLTTLQRDYFRANPTGAIISRINNDINGVRMLMGVGLMMVFNSVGTLSLAPYYMYTLSPRLTLYCAAPIILAFSVLQIAVRTLRREQLTQMKGMQDLSDFTVESYTGIDVIKSYRGMEWAVARFGVPSTVVRNSAIRMSTVRGFFMPILTHIANGLKVLVVLVGGWMVVEGEMSMGGFLAFLMYLSMLVPPLMGMTFMMFILQRGFTALVSLKTVFNTTPGLPPTDPEAQAALPDILAQGLKVRGLGFAYTDNPENPILHDVNLEVAPGEVVGLFGSIGSGKSTLVNLLNGYLTPPPGTVTLDGLDVNDLGQALLRRHVGTVTQEPFLFSDTVRNNITLGAPLPEGENGGEALAGTVDTAVTHAALSEDLERFPGGLETLVGEKGITLSGGQKQRISLARSILKPCDLLILDDVLSAVDHETERFLIDRIYDFEHARATLIVSHRISALERANRVVVLEDGRVIESGTHAELIDRPGPYRSAWLLQDEEIPEGGQHETAGAAGAPGGGES